MFTYTSAPTWTHFTRTCNAAMNTVKAHAAKYGLTLDDLKDERKQRFLCASLDDRVLLELFKEFYVVQDGMDNLDNQISVLRQDHEELKMELNQLKTQVLRLEQGLQQSQVSKPIVNYDPYIKYLLDQYELFEITIPDRDDLDGEQYSSVLYNDFSRHTDNLYTFEEFLG